MKKAAAYKIPSNWYREVIENPFDELETAFQHACVGNYTTVFTDALLCVYAPRMYSGSDPAGLLSDFEKIEMIINAVYVLYKTKDAQIKEQWWFDVSNETAYKAVFVQPQKTQWVPRYLSHEECVSPYLAIRSFFKYQSLAQWKEDLEEILTSALSRYSDQVTINLFPIYFYLTKFLEAAYVISEAERIQLRIEALPVSESANAGNQPDM